MPFHNIDTNTAATMITAFLNDPTLGDIGVDHSIGGLIDLRIQSGGTNAGWAFWYCWNLNNANYPRLFLAYEENDYSIGNPDQTDINNLLLKMPFERYIFKYPSTKPRTQAEVLDFLRNATKEWNTVKYNDSELDQDLVIDFTDGFLADFPVPNTANTFNDYSFGFFNQIEAEEFKGQGTYVRYYFGLDPDSSINKIRIILVSVDANGISQHSPNYYLLEQSWPPDP